MEFNNRKSVNEKLSVFGPYFDNDDYIEVTEWANGEGFDISIERKNKSINIPLHFDELEAINFLVKSLDYNKKQ